MTSSKLDRVSSNSFALTTVATVVMAMCASAQAQPAAQALPSGAQVVSGSASISTQGAAMQIQQNSAKLITNWQNFDIGSAAKVEFIQPSASAMALNRVTGAEAASQIFGVLKSNGRIFLVNPNGILFGATAKVDVGGLVASTLDIKDQDFLNGQYQFDLKNPVGQVKNFGELVSRQGGFVALLGAAVDNEGRVVATGGQAALAAGQTVRLQIGETGLLGMDVTAGQTNTQVSNSGTVIAQGGNVLMSAQSAAGLLSGAVNLSGLVQASRIDGQGGNVRLDGGDVTVTAAGRIDATGQGTDVTLWAERNTRMDGTINALGGKVDTSSKGELGIRGTVNAPEWVLDPLTLTVVNTVPTSGNDINADYYVAASSIQNYLNGGANPGNTTQGVPATVVVGFNDTAPRTLSLLATNQITINADISKTAGGDATLVMGTQGGGNAANITVNNPISSIAGRLNLQFGASASDNNGQATLNAPLNTNGGTVTFYKEARLAHATPISTKITENNNSGQSGSIIFEKNAVLAAPGYAVSLDAQGPQSGGSYTGRGGNIQFKANILSGQPTGLPQFAQALTLDTSGYASINPQTGPGNIILGTNAGNMVGGTDRAAGTVNAIKSLTLRGDTEVDLNAGTINIVSSNGDVITASSRLGTQSVTPTIRLNAENTTINVYGDANGNLAGNVAGYTDYLQSTFNIAGGLSTAQSLTVNSDRAIKLVDRSITANSGVGAAGLQVTLNPNSGSGVGGVVMNNASVSTGGRDFTVNNAEGNGNDVQLLTDGFYAYNSQITTAGGDLRITAQAPTDTAAGAGIRLLGANTLLSTGAGDMTLSGSANHFAASGNKDGVIIGEGGNARVQLRTTTGNVSITGDASGVGSGDTVTGGSRYNGVMLSSKALIQTDSGHITIEGSGGGGDKVFIAENHGVKLADADTSVLSASGNIAIVGASGGKTRSTSGANSFGIYAEGANMYIGTGAGAYATTGANAGLLTAGPTATGHITLAADSMQFINTSASHLKVATKAPASGSARGENNGGEIRIHTLDAGTAIEIGATTGEVAFSDTHNEVALRGTPVQYLGSNWFNGSTNAIFQPGARDVVIGNARANVNGVDHVNGEVATTGSTSTLTVSAATTFRDNLVLDMNGTGGRVNVAANLTVAGTASEDRTLTLRTGDGAQAAGIVRADAVQLLGSGDQAFTAGNLVNTLSADVNGNVYFVNNQNLQVGTVSVFGGDAAVPGDHGTRNKWLDRTVNGQSGLPTVGITSPGHVTLDVTNGQLDQTAAGAIQAAGLSARATTHVDLFKAEANDVDQLAGRAAAGDFAWKDRDGFNVSTVVNDLARFRINDAGARVRDDISLTHSTVIAEGVGNTVDLQARTGNITQNQFVRAERLRARADTGNVELTGVDNNVAQVSGRADLGSFAYTDADNLQVGTTGASRSDAATAGVMAAATVDLRSVAGALSQTSGGVLNSASLHASAATGVVLDTAANTVGTLAGSTTANDFVYKDANALIVGTAAGVNGVAAAAGRVSLETTTGALSQTANGVITSPSLRAVGAAGVALATAANNVQTLAGQTTTHGFAFRNAGAFAVGTAQADGARLQSEGIATATLVDLQTAAGTITQTAAGGITGGQLRAVAPGGVALATATDNDVQTLAGAASAGHFAFRDALGGLVVGTAGASQGVSANGTNGTVDLHVAAGTSAQTAAGQGTLTQTQAITGAALRAQARDGVTLTLANNDVTQLAGAVTSGDFSYRDANGVTVSTVPATPGSADGNALAGIRTDVSSATIDLNAGGALNQNAGAAIAAKNARLVATSVDLKERNNAVSELAGIASTGAFAFYGTADLKVGTVNIVQGVSAAGQVDLQSRGNLTLAQAVTGVGPGDEANDEAVVLRAEKRFFNETGLGRAAIDANGGRWLVYDNNPQLLNKDMAGLDADRNFLLINKRYDDYLPQDVYAKGNGYITTAEAIEPSGVQRAATGHQAVAIGNQMRQFTVGELSRQAEINRQVGMTAPVMTSAYGSVAVLASGAAVPLRVAVPVGRAFKLDLSDVVGKGRVSGIAAADGSATPWVSATGNGQLIGTAPKATELVVSITEPGQSQPRRVRVQLQAL